MKHLSCLALVLGLSVFGALRAEEDPNRTKPRSHGARIGLASDPDQFVGGLHWNLGDWLDRTRFQPSVELGLGDGVTSIVGTAPLYYSFDSQRGVTPYAGGGLTLALFDIDRGRDRDDDTDFEIALRAGGGVEWRSKRGRNLFVELTVGIGDVHDAVIVAGWLF